MTFADLGLSDELLRAVTESGYDAPTPIQTQAIPSVLMMRDIDRHRADRHRQDRRLRAADDRHSRRGPQPRPHAALADPRADPRAGDAGRREFRQIRQISQAQHGAADRRHQHGRPDQEAGKGRRRADRDAGPADGPVRPRQDHAQRLQPARHRRGGPDARHGLHPGHRGNLHEAAEEPADAAVHRDDAAGRSRSWPTSS